MKELLLLCLLSTFVLRTESTGNIENTRNFFIFLLQSIICFASAITCNTDGTITFFSEDFINQYILIIDNNCVFVQFAGDGIGLQNVTTGCHDFVLDTSFGFITSSSNQFVDGVSFTGNCTSAVSQTVSVYPTFVPTFLASVSDTVQASLALTVTPSSQTIGRPVTATVSLIGGSINYYTMLLVDLTITDVNTGASVHIVENGCPNTLITGTVSATPGNAGSTSVVVPFTALIPVLNGQFPNAGAYTLRLRAFVNLCDLNDQMYGDLCYVADGCSGDPKYGRKRRQVDTRKEITEDIQIVFFTDEDTRQQCLDIVRKDYDVSDVTETTSNNAICFNRTAIILLFIIQNTAMVICLIGACWMFMRFRQSRNPQDTAKSELALSDKSSKSSSKMSTNSYMDMSGKSSARTSDKSSDNMSYKSSANMSANSCADKSVKSFENMSSKRSINMSD